MTANRRTRSSFRRLSAWPWLVLAVAATGSFTVRASVPAASGAIASTAHSLVVDLGSARLDVHFVTAGIVGIHFMPGDQTTARAMVLDPARLPTTFAEVQKTEDANGTELTSATASIHWNRQQHRLEIADSKQHSLLGIDTDRLQQGQLHARHAVGDAVYGIGGYNATDDASAGLLRNGKLEAKSGEQGHAGAPFAWSTAGYGLLLDVDGATFTLTKGTIGASSLRKDTDVYILLGTPEQIFDSLASLSGHTPLFPKWAMGFTNSQWGIDQQELTQIVDTYRAKHIPIDNITLDFDWKAWGEDNYGEFRWNPIKFPDGPSGALKKQMEARGMHLTGIMKPRIHVDTVEGRYASAHKFWVPGEKVSDDYFSHKPVKDIDFDIPAARQWFGDLAMKYGFADGIAGWWNDEADTVGSTTEFMNMQRALYDSQRAVSNQRVWSINRNFWLGAQRYAYGLWSGDINTGFENMAAQRARMLSAINVGAMQWGMDGGGFRGGMPTPENYARWIQFGAFTPIFRVHGDFGQKRQPWVYGPVAEKAATAAIRLRYALIPYIYSYEHSRRMTGVGLVRPLLFGWPHDPQVRNDIDSWLFGDWLLVSPVVEQGQTAKNIYLPAGRWIDWFSGKTYDGGQIIHLATDAKRWSDIPLFVRAGAIIPSQPAMNYVGEQPLTQLEVDVFPAAQHSSFNYYDDDGISYDYEQGAYFSQTLSVQRDGHEVQFQTGAVSGSYQPALKFYLLKIHGDDDIVGTVTINGKQPALFTDLDALQNAQGEGWARGKDRFGPVTWVRVVAGAAQTVRLAPTH
ncbi:glycoside hydrolase family 31 protein [Rhodanobacter sp. AS-Z3]|uniref:TIM-barrel domain-containing protein n=1 Tax=Rhodanobacter sp. AS-Z3 TaxID=3031330 RepID=UPI002478F7D1|nr:TIM-barrel domain-containing protein [Rhodanobacter sp. AS-Z3]WEN14658.1 glycoside hydrolase family 31 protein [Rhodanobacter sp. AS-Z3]